MFSHELGFGARQQLATREQLSLIRGPPHEKRRGQDILEAVLLGKGGGVVV